MRVFAQTRHSRECVEWIVCVDTLCYSGMGSEKIVHEMRRADVQRLHDAIADEWDEWVNEAIGSGVPGWTNNMFLAENVPIGIVVQYGQNQPVCRQDEEARREESDHWHRIHSYQNMRSMAMAIATHVQ